MKPLLASWTAVFALLLTTAGCVGPAKTSAPKAEPPRSAKPVEPVATAEAEVDARYAAASPEIKEYVLWTAKNFGAGKLWLPENEFASLSAEAREKRIQYLATLFNEAEYGRHLCSALAEAGALKDPRLVPGLMKVAGYHRDDQDYDCRPKWLAVAALARQESAESVPLLISLVDHGNQNTRNWARAALAREMKQDCKQDKRAWAQAWVAQGHAPVAEPFLKPYTPPAAAAKP